MGGGFSKVCKWVGGAACVIFGACTAGAGFALAPFLGGSNAAGGMYLMERGGMRPRGRVPLGQVSMQLGSNPRNDELERMQRARRESEARDLVSINAEAKRVDGVQSTLDDFFQSTYTRHAVERHIENVGRHLQLQEGKAALDAYLLNDDGGGGHPSSSQATETQIANNLFARLDTDELDMQLERQFANLSALNVVTVGNVAMLDNDYDALPQSGAGPSGLISQAAAIPLLYPIIVSGIIGAAMMTEQMRRRRERDGTNVGVCLLPRGNNPDNNGRCGDGTDRVDFNEMKKQAGEPGMIGKKQFLKDLAISGGRRTLQSRTLMQDLVK